LIDYLDIYLLDTQGCDNAHLKSIFVYCAYANLMANVFMDYTLNGKWCDSTNKSCC